MLSLNFQQVNGLSPLTTGLAFLPMMGPGLLKKLVAARAAQRCGALAAITAGAVIVAAGAAALIADVATFSGLDARAKFSRDLGRGTALCGPR